MICLDNFTQEDTFVTQYSTSLKIFTLYYLTDFSFNIKSKEVLMIHFKSENCKGNTVLQAVTG